MLEHFQKQLQFTENPECDILHNSMGNFMTFFFHFTYHYSNIMSPKPLKNILF